MSAKSTREDELRDAINGLTTTTLMRLQLVAKIFDPRRHEDLLQEAVVRTLSGKRKWRGGTEFFWHLYGAMRSIAWDWAKKQDENFVLESQINNGDDGNVLSGFPASGPDPERQAIASFAVSRITESCESDPIVLALLRGKLLGKIESEIREELSLTSQDFHAAAQRLRRSAKKVLEEGPYV